MTATPEPRTTRKIVGLLLASQSILSAATIMVFTVASIAAVDLAGGNRSWTGIPSTVSLVAAALAAYPVGRLMDRVGRRLGLSLGHLLGIAGAAISGWAFLAGSLAGFMAGAFFLGAARGPLELGRYAAAEASPAARRGRAISLVVLGGTVGSIAGPTLINLGEQVETIYHLPAGLGVWVLAGAFFAIGAVLLFVFLRPDPLTLGRQFEAEEADSADPVTRQTRPNREILADPRAPLAVGAMVFSQLSMVIVMTITPVHMSEHAHALGAISLVIMAHTLGMFGLSFVTGWLVDKLGRNPVILIGGAMSAAACAIAPISTSTAWLALALFLLGLGWNFSFVGGSALLDDLLRPSEKGRVQGLVDAVVKVASGAGSLGSGVLFAWSSFAATSLLTVIVAVMPVLLVVFTRMRQPMVVGGSAAD